MNEKNVDYLEKQMKYTGFGEGHGAQLREEIGKGEASFVLFHKADSGTDSAIARLEFTRSSQTENYFLNRYALSVKQGDKDDLLQQTFYLGFKEPNITLKEGYNLLSGRAVHKELMNKEGEKYTAWQQLNFSETDKAGNYKIKQFHQNYDYNLEAVLAKHPIKELSATEDRSRLMDSLQRGNRQAVTFVLPDKEVRLFIEAAPQYKSINIYDSSMKRVQAHELTGKKEDALSQKQGQKKEIRKKSDSDGSDNIPKPAAKRKKKQGQSF